MVLRYVMSAVIISELLNVRRRDEEIMAVTDKEVLEAYDTIREYCQIKICPECMFQAEEESGLMCIFESKTQEIPGGWQELEIE